MVVDPIAKASNKIHEIWQFWVELCPDPRIRVTEL